MTARRIVAGLLSLCVRIGSMLVFEAEFASDIEHTLLGKIARGTRSTEYYWLDRWYNIFRFAEPSGRLLNFYCNINQPPVFEQHTLRYVDLDVDVLVAPDFSYQILDEDEFAFNAARFNYPAHILRRTQEARDELVRLIEQQAFPFNQAATDHAAKGS